MIPYATETARDQEYIAQATWQAALLRQLADDLEQSSAARGCGAILADDVELLPGTQIAFTLRSGRPPQVEVSGPIKNRGASEVSVHP